MLTRRELLGSAAVVAGSPLAALAQGKAATKDWANWRGPHYNGAAEATGLPVKFSPTSGVKWSAALPGPSASTPVIWKDHIFVSSAEMQSESLLALAFDRRTGKQLWKQPAGSGYRPAGVANKVFQDPRSNYSSNSPVTDGKRVIFYYGNGDLVSYDFNGDRQWSRNIQQDYGDYAFGWTYSTSPLLHAGKLYIQILQRDIPVSGRGRPNSDSYLLALDPTSGKELWRASRPTPAKMESREAFTTPIPHTHNGRKELLVAGGNLLSGHDPETGKELWRWGTWNPDHREQFWRLVPSPVAGGGVVLGCAPKREPVYAVKLGGNGDISQGGLAWQSEPRSPVTSDVPTPLFYRDRFYVLSDVRKNISCVQPADGKVLWTTELPGAMCWSSPTGADGKVYFMSLDGQVYVVDAESGALLAANAMAPGENEMRSTIPVVQNQLFVRTNSRLFCIGA